MGDCRSNDNSLWRFYKHMYRVASPEMAAKHAETLNILCI